MFYTKNHSNRILKCPLLFVDLCQNSWTETTFFQTHPCLSCALYDSAPVSSSALILTVKSGDDNISIFEPKEKQELPPTPSSTWRAVSQSSLRILWEEFWQNIVCNLNLPQGRPRPHRTRQGTKHDAVHLQCRPHFARCGLFAVLDRLPRWG